MLRPIGYLCLTLAMLGCVSTQSQVVFEPGVVDGPKVIALSGPRHPWTVEIEKLLRSRGYEIKRFASTTRATELTSPGRVESYNQSSARVVLHVDGFAPNTSMTRCFGGGYKFSYIIAEIIDTARNVSLATYSNSGYSENCPPLSGTIFRDIADMVDAVFSS